MMYMYHVYCSTQMEMFIICYLGISKSLIINIEIICYIYIIYIYNTPVLIRLDISAKGF